jgi:kojibiose phosphorylase
MSAYGAEIILDTAVFWSSRANWNAAQDRYEILDVIGPDEFHERVDNNAFTNQMVRWHLKTALVVLDWLRQHQAERADELESQLGLSSDRLGKWLDMIDKLWIPQNPDNGLIEQFQGFFNLEDLNLDDYEPRRRSMQAILGIEGANQRQVLKQADVLMLLYLLREAAFVKPVEECDRQTLQTNWNYYVPRTDHTYGSSLGPPVHAILACDLGKVDDAYDHFMQAALVDLLDVRGNAAEGIHAASAGGVWQTVMYGFAGIRLTADGPIAAPKLPPGWTRLKFQLLWQGQSYEFDLRAEDAERMILEETFSASPSFPLSVSEPLPMSSIQAVIFDLDGVLTDTSEFHYLGWQRLADEEGIPFDREKNEALRGISRRDSLIYLLNGRSVTEEQFQEMMARKNGYYLDLIRTMTPEHLLPGVSELLADLQAAGVKVAIGSSSKNAKEVLQRLGIVNQIDAIADGHSVTQSKPAPDVFLHAAAQLGLDPTTCVVVEDAPAGVEAALRAGMWAIGLGPEERVNTAHSVFPNLAGIRWTDLVDALSEAKAETTKVASVVS